MSGVKQLLAEVLEVDKPVNQDLNPGMAQKFTGKKPLQLFDSKDKDL